ncbi:MAG: hypothetical protein U0359_30405 [Byssovorax sp.]
MDLLLLAADPEGPTGLAQGRYPVPAWVIWIAAGGVVLLGAMIVAIRIIRARRARDAAARPGNRTP